LPLHRDFDLTRPLKPFVPRQLLKGLSWAFQIRGFYNGLTVLNHARRRQ
jgi:hypothetical protein